MLRREGFAGSVTLLFSDDAAPYDRPNCSKDYLAGNAPEDWMPLKPPEFYKELTIDVVLGADVTGIDAKARQVMIAGGRSVAFDKLLLATGAEPVRLDVPGANQPHVHVLRSLSDSRAIVAKAKRSASRRGARRELYRTGGRRFPESARTGGTCRGTGSAADGTRTRP
jgi:NAD(P)H-nitrite reductase large subunit